MPVLVKDANAAITQSFSDLVHLIAIVRREREMVQTSAPSMVTSANVRMWRLNQHKIEPVEAPTPPFSPRLERLVAEQTQKPVPEMRRPREVGDVELDVGNHHLSLGLRHRAWIRTCPVSPSGMKRCQSSKSPACSTHSRVVCRLG